MPVIADIQSYSNVLIFLLIWCSFRWIPLQRSTRPPREQSDLSHQKAVIVTVEARTAMTMATKAKHSHSMITEEGGKQSFKVHFLMTIFVY